MTDPVQKSFDAARRDIEVKRRLEAEHALNRTVARIDDVDQRWDEDAVRAAITPLIADVLREAGREQPEAVARSLAPHIVGTVRTEIKNSEDEIIDVLTPRLGRLIGDAVGKAVDELQQQVDQALPVERWIAQIQARLTGKPALGMLLDDANPFLVHEALLIERGSGQLLAHEWPGGEAEGEDRPDDHLLSGMIAAIDSFAKDALSEEGGGGLRRIDTETGSLLMRASATRILALRASGEPSAEIESRLDAMLETILEQRDGEMDGSILPARPVFEEGAALEAAEGGVSAFGLIVKAAGFMFAAIGLIWGHFVIEQMRRDRFVAEIETKISETGGVLSYPLTARMDAERNSVLVEGIVPDERALLDMRTELSRVAPVFPVEVRVAVAGQRLSE